MKTKFQKLTSRVERLRGERQTTFSYLEAIYDYSMPNRQTFTKFSTGQKMDNQIFDSTAVIAVNNYVSRIQSLLVKPWTKWFIFEAGSSVPIDDRKGINEELELVSDTVFEELNYSNFSEQISSSFYDLAASTGVIMVREDNRPNSDSNLVFESIPLANVMLETASDGDIKTVFRDIKIAVGQIEAKWPKAKITSDMKNMIEMDDAQQVELTEGVVYNEKEMNYNFVLFEKSVDEKALLLDEILDESPYIVFREYVTPGETYGRGRLQSVFSDIKSANKIQELVLSAAAMSIAGVYTAVSDGVFNVNNARFAPGSVIPVTSNGANPTLAPLSNASNLQVADFELQYLRTNINTVMLTMPLGDINEVKGRTATEMSIRQNDFMQTSVAGFNRLQTELLNKIIKKTMAVLKRMGKVEPIDINGKEVKVKYTSPIATLSGDEELNKIRMLMEFAGGLPPEVANSLIAYEKIPQDVLSALDLPEKYIRSEQEVQKIAEMQQMQQQQQMQIEQQKAMPQ